MANNIGWKIFGVLTGIGVLLAAGGVVFFQQQISADSRSSRDRDDDEEREDDDSVLNFDGKEETKMIAIGSASS